MALDRHSIEKKDFPLGTRGYDPDAVDAHLSALADEVAGFKEEARRRSDNVAALASERVRTIVEAAEHSAAEITRAAEEDARGIREDATNEAQASRDNAAREAREYLDKVSGSTHAMLERLNAMEQEMNAMIETVRAGSDRLTSDLQQLESGLGDVSSAIAPRPPFVPDAAAGVPAAEAPGADVPHGHPGELQEPQFAGRFEPGAVAPEHIPEADPAAQSPPAPEAAELSSVAGEPSHTNGFDQPPSAPQGDAEGARLIALNMALNGTPREETARYLSENFHLADVGGLLDEVYASVES